MVALSAVCRGPDGHWALSTLAAHPGGFARTVITRDRRVGPDGRSACAPSGAARRRRGRCRSTWARTRGSTSRCTTPSHGRDGRSGRSASRTRSRGCRSTGIRSCSRPACAASVRAGDLALDLDGAVGYAEKNWGRGFPGRWWWGHAATFADGDVSVSFAGGRVPLPGADVAPTAVVVRLGRAASSRWRRRWPGRASRSATARWRLRTRGRGYRRRDRGRRRRRVAHELLVPVPAERAASRARASISRAASRCGCGAAGACSTTAARRSRGSSSACRSARLRPARRQLERLGADERLEAADHGPQRLAAAARRRGRPARRAPRCTARAPPSPGGRRPSGRTARAPCPARPRRGTSSGPARRG